MKSPIDTILKSDFDAAIEESKLFCLGCSKKEGVVVPGRSGVVGLAAVHSSGMICIPSTVVALVKERQSK